MNDVDIVTLVIQEMSKQFPSLMDTLVHERDKLVLYSSLYVAPKVIMMIFLQNAALCNSGTWHVCCQELQVSIARSWQLLVESILKGSRRTGTNL